MIRLEVDRSLLRILPPLSCPGNPGLGGTHRAPSATGPARHPPSSAGSHRPSSSSRRFLGRSSSWQRVLRPGAVGVNDSCPRLLREVDRDGARLVQVSPNSDETSPAIDNPFPLEHVRALDSSPVDETWRCLHQVPTHVFLLPLTRFEVESPNLIVLRALSSLSGDDPYTSGDPGTREHQFPNPVRLSGELRMPPRPGAACCGCSCRAGAVSASARGRAGLSQLGNRNGGSASNVIY